MSKSIGQSESLRHWPGKGRMGCSLPVTERSTKTRLTANDHVISFPTSFLPGDFFLVMSMESVTKLSLKRSLSETFHDAGVILYMSKSIFPR